MRISDWSSDVCSSDLLLEQADKQEELSEKTKEGAPADQGSLEKEQQVINKEFERLEEQLERLSEKNQELENHHRVQPPEEDKAAIRQDLEKRLEQWKKEQRSRQEEPKCEHQSLMRRSTK